VQRKPDIDLLVLNTEGTGIDTPDLVRSVRRAHPGLPVLHIGKDPIPDMPDDVLNLPDSFAVDELLAAVRTLVPNPGVDRPGVDDSNATARRYSPGVCIGAGKTWVMGDPDMAHVSTSYVERQDLTMRMGMRRFTRLTNAFSKKGANHAYRGHSHDALQFLPPQYDPDQESPAPLPHDARNGGRGGRPRLG
jgi:hypothetical protein